LIAEQTRTVSSPISQSLTHSAATVTSVSFAGGSLSGSSGGGGGGGCGGGGGGGRGGRDKPRAGPRDPCWGG